MNQSRKYLSAAIVSGLCAGFVQTASSAPAAVSSLEEIVVTARKRTESMMDVPIQVNAISGEELARGGIADLSSLGEKVPQVSMARANSGAGAAFSIRGVGTSFNDPGVAQSVAVNIDGITVSRGPVFFLGMLDLAQVEVLKGPQSTYFGKNSPAGVISLNSADPTEQLEGFVRAGYEFGAKEKIVEAAVGGPLTDSLKARVAMRASEAEGWVTNDAQSVPADQNPFAGRVFGTTPASKHNEPENQAARLTVLYEPVDNFDANFKIAWAKQEENFSPTGVICDPTANIEGVPNIISSGEFVPDPYGTCAFDQRTTLGEPDPAILENWPGARDGYYGETEIMLGRLTMNYEFSDLTITSVTGFMDLENAQFFDFTVSSYAALAVPNSEDTKQLSQEIRLISDFAAPVNFTAGAYFENTKRESRTASMLLFAGEDSATGKYHTIESLSDNDNDAWSVFGQLEWEFAENFKLLAGIRYTNEEKKSDLLREFTHPAVSAFFPWPDTPRSDTFDDENTSVETTLTWRPTFGGLFFASYKQGYKSGGFTSVALVPFNASMEDLTFESETVDGFELGYKGELMDGKVRFQANAYTYSYEDLQSAFFDNRVFGFVVENAEGLDVEGGEVSIDWLALDGLQFSFSGSYNKAEYGSLMVPCYRGQTAGQGCDSTSGLQNLKGETPNRAPLWTWSVGAKYYDISLSDDLMMGLSVEANYSDNVSTNDILAPMGDQDAYTLVNSNISFYSADGAWRLELIGRNLGDEEFKTLTVGKPSGNVSDFWSIVPRGREVLLQATYNF